MTEILYVFGPSCTEQTYQREDGAWVSSVTVEENGAVVSRDETVSTETPEFFCWLDGESIVP